MFRNLDTKFNFIILRKEEDKFIDLKLIEINNQKVIINEGLTDRELTCSFYINEYFNSHNCDTLFIGIRFDIFSNNYNFLEEVINIK